MKRIRKPRPHLSQTTREHLEATRTVLLERGWRQGGRTLTRSRDSLPSEGPLCLMHAVRIARSSATDTYGARDAIKAAAGCRIVTVWNDTPGRTSAEVLDVLDRAIKAAS